MIFAAGDARAAISRVAATASAPSSQVPSSAAAVIGPWLRHVNLWIVARGINIGLSTRMYFADEEEANAADPVLNIIEPASRRKTLVGQRQMRDQEVVYNFDIYLQGERETVFFDI
jgi:protocatechuate 3,4-dioxygenase beta subunit